MQATVAMTKNTPDLPLSIPKAAPVFSTYLSSNMPGSKTKGSPSLSQATAKALVHWSRAISRTRLSMMGKAFLKTVLPGNAPVSDIVIKSAKILLLYDLL